MELNNKPKGIILLVDGFEDTEALTTIDILFRAGIKPTLVNMNTKSNIITTQCQNELLVNTFYNDITLSDYDYLIIPGGGAIKKTLINDKRVEEAINNFVSRDKLVCAICAGPMTIGKLGYFKSHKFTCFPTCETGIEGKYTPVEVVQEEKFITGKSMGYTINFALKIVEYLLGKETSKRIEKSILGKN